MKPKILLYDLETGPNLAWVWGKYEQDVLGDFVQEWELLTFSWKWLGEKAVHSLGRDMLTEEQLVYELHSLFNEADIIIAHNGDKFDQRMSNVKFAQYGFRPPAPYKSIDTLKVARKYFRFNSNKLDDLGAFFGLGRKVKTGGFSLWLGVMNGDAVSQKKMLKYNEQDVRLLEKVYLKLRPWMDNHPGINILTGRPKACPKCGGATLHARGERATKVALQQRYQCQGCGGWCFSRKSIKTEIQFVN